MNFLGQPVSLASEKLTRFGSLLVKTGNFCFLAKKKKKKKKKNEKKKSTKTKVLTNNFQHKTCTNFVKKLVK
jgi:hypothetical protein